MWEGVSMLRHFYLYMISPEIFLNTLHCKMFSTQNILVILACKTVDGLGNMKAQTQQATVYVKYIFILHLDYCSNNVIYIHSATSTTEHIA